MTRMNKLSSYHTSVALDHKGGRVIYRGTTVVQWNETHITLRSGGWHSVTTKRKMNQASNQFCLGYSVTQKRGHWFVTLDHKPNAVPLPFTDGMTFERETYTRRDKIKEELANDPHCYD